MSCGTCPVLEVFDESKDAALGSSPFANFVARYDRNDRFRQLSLCVQFVVRYKSLSP